MQLAEIYATVAGDDADVEFSAYDGSRAGNADSDVRLVVKNPDAVAALASAPGQLGLARAYVTGNLDVEGDLYEALLRLSHIRPDGVSLADKARIGKVLAPFVLNRPEPPPEEVRLGGRRHSRRRDADAISHHYDVSNLFYSWVLGPTMAYTCAVFPKPGSTLEEAQAEKFDLVARKLGLHSGERVLDVGCGWGGFAIHAAREYGVSVLAVTLSEQQAEYGRAKVAELGLEDYVDLRYLDYRKVPIPARGFDAIASIGLTEHIGVKNYGAYFGRLRDLLKDEGRLLNHTITRTSTQAPVMRRGSFINRYIFPDGELAPVSTVMRAIEQERLEIRHSENLREHYAMTLKAWSENLDDHWPEAVMEVGESKARVWRLYLAASRMGFATNRIQLHQILCVRDAPDGTSGMPLRPDWGA